METTELTYKTIKFTPADVLWFAKVKFRLWKTAFDCANNEEKLQKKGVVNVKNKRMQRKKHVRV
jgi:hypothetical protein